MSERQSAAIKAWWDARKAAGWSAPRMSLEEKRRREREQKAAKYRANPEAAREAARQRYAQNKEAISARRKTAEARATERVAERKRRASTRDVLRLRDKQRYARNRDKKLAANTRWRAKNRERVRANARKRDALKRGSAIGPIDYGRVLAESGGVCGICMATVDVANPKVYHFDHIVPLARGGTHTQGNIQLAHAVCNMRKWAGSGAPAPLGAGGWL